MENSKTKQIVSILVVVAVLVVGYFLLRNTKPPTEEAIKIEGVEVNTGNTEKNTEDLNIGIKPISADDHIMGDINAKIIIVEYSDTECPFCKVFHSTMQRILAKYGTNVAWVYRHYPIAQLHPKAFHEAEATECAWELGGNTAFWKYTNEVYSRTESNNKLPVEDLPKIAQMAGLNVKAFNTCLASGKFANKINADIMDGQMNGVEGTPTSFILMDGKVVDKIEGAQPFEGVQQKIESLLN